MSLKHRYYYQKSIFHDLEAGAKNIKQKRLNKAIFMCSS